MWLLRPLPVLITLVLHYKFVSSTTPRIGNGNLLQYSCLQNSMDRGTWWASVHGLDWSLRVGCDWACAHICILPGGTLHHGWIDKAEFLRNGVVSYSRARISLRARSRRLHPASPQQSPVTSPSWAQSGRYSLPAREHTRLKCQDVTIRSFEFFFEYFLRTGKICIP